MKKTWNYNVLNIKSDIKQRLHLGIRESEVFEECQDSFAQSLLAQLCWLGFYRPHTKRQIKPFSVSVGFHSSRLSKVRSLGAAGLAQLLEDVSPPLQKASLVLDSLEPELENIALERGNAQGRYWSPGARWQGGWPSLTLGVSPLSSGSHDDESPETVWRFVLLTKGGEDCVEGGWQKEP